MQYDNIYGPNCLQLSVCNTLNFWKPWYKTSFLVHRYIFRVSRSSTYIKVIVCSDLPVKNWLWNRKDILLFRRGSRKKYLGGINFWLFNLEMVYFGAHLWYSDVIIGLLGFNNAYMLCNQKCLGGQGRGLGGQLPPLPPPRTAPAAVDCAKAGVLKGGRQSTIWTAKTLLVDPGSRLI